MEHTHPGAGAGGGLPGAPTERKLPEPITVSVICPTFNRHHVHEALYQNFDSQTYAHKDLCVLDDTRLPSPFFTQLKDPRVHYFHHAGRLTTGRKRNLLMEKAAGSVIAHFDDDDLYAPNYLASMLEHLVRADADFVKLAVWTEHRLRDGHRWHARPSGHADLWGYGFSYMFRRHVATRVSCPDKTNSEDYVFACGASRAGFRLELIHHGADWATHVLHGQNTSRRD